jgi:enoyl-CoA hydratase/carnithine racemase
MASMEGVSALRASFEGPVGELLLDRPERLNALSRELLEELAAAARWFDAQAEVKAVIVRGAGRAFCAGADLGAFGSSAAGVSRDAVDAGRRMAEAIGAMRAMTVAAIHGHCVGGGFVLAVACDLRIAAQDTRFAIPEVDIGIPLTWSGIPRMVRELGPAITKELVLTCRPFDAAEARELRFLNAVVPESELHAASRALAERLAAQPAYSLELTKRHVNAVAEEAGSTARSFWEPDAFLAALRDEESLARAAAYLERRRRG